MKARREIKVEELEFQIAPMIDVLLVLLVFFIMITSASVLRSDKNITLPVAKHSTKKDMARAEALINVHWIAEENRGVVMMENVSYKSVEEIEPILTPRYKENNKYRAVIRADKDTPSQFVQKVMATCAAAGIADITFSVLNQ